VAKFRYIHISKRSVIPATATPTKLRVHDAIPYDRIRWRDRVSVPALAVEFSVGYGSELVLTAEVLPLLSYRTNLVQNRRNFQLMKN
jgi:hypothetical protein